MQQSLKFTVLMYKILSFIFVSATNKIFKTFVLCFLFLGTGSLFAQIDQSSGSFKIPAIPDTTKAGQDIESDIPKDNQSITPESSENPFSGDITPQPNNTLEQESPTFYMLERERFADAGARYTQQMNEREQSRKADKAKPGHQFDQDLGTYRTGSVHLDIMCRDHEYVDGDRVSILVNDEVVQPEIILGSNYKGFKLKLEKGFNKISFKALNQGSSGPNTAQFVVYSDDGSIIAANEWNLLIGVKANIVVIKEN